MSNYNIQRQVEGPSVAAILSTSKKRDDSSSDVVNPGDKPSEKQVITRLSTNVKGLPSKVYSDVCLMLSIKRSLGCDDFRMLAEKVGLSKIQTEFLEQKYQNPTDEILKTWSIKSEATVGKLIELLKEKDFDRTDVAEILENWVYGRS